MVPTAGRTRQRLLYYFDAALKKKIWCSSEKISLNAQVCRDIKNITISFYTTSPNDNFSGKMCFFSSAGVTVQRLQACSRLLCINRLSVFTDEADLNLLSLANILHISACSGIWSENGGRKTTCLCLWSRKTDDIYITAVLFPSLSILQIFKCVKLE